MNTAGPALPEVDLKPYVQAIRGLEPLRTEGKVSEVVGNLITAYNPGLQIGDTCQLAYRGRAGDVSAEVVGFRGKNAFLMPLGDVQGLGPDCRIFKDGESAEVPVGAALLGRVLDGLGRPIDAKGKLETHRTRPIYSVAPNPLSRKRILKPLDVGVRSINALTTLGMGQRMGIMAGSGVGKSVLMGMIARNTNADVNVIGLIGERGREVKEFIEKDLGEEGSRRSVVVAATSDQSPLVRMRGAFTAIAIAEFFRDAGMNVLLMMDSVTRFAMAQREIGLSVGEPPTTKGYPPSVFSLLPKLMERAGNGGGEGTLTALFTVLIEADDVNEPIGDAVRSIVDGHILLDRKLASRGHYPAIDVLNSRSRIMTDVVSQAGNQFAMRFSETYSIYKEAEDLINIGAYVAGANPKIDYSISKIDEINAFLRQGTFEKATLEQSFAKMESIVRDFPASRSKPPPHPVGSPPANKPVGRTLPLSPSQNKPASPDSSPLPNP